MIWLRPQQPAMPRITLTRDQIATAAVELADRQGLEAVSMRQLAAGLGCGTMSLYRHVRTKDELYELMIDFVAGEEVAATPAPSGDWRTDLRALARLRRAGVHRHRWLPRLQAGRPCLGPNVVAASEHALSVVAGPGLPVTAAVRIIRAVDAFVLGFVQIELAEQQWRHPVDEQSGDDDWYARTVAYLRHLGETGDYPHFTRMVTETDAVDPDADFEWQLDRILDGFAAIVP